MDNSLIGIQGLVETYLKDYNIAHEIIEIISIGSMNL